MIALRGGRKENPLRANGSGLFAASALVSPIEDRCALTEDEAMILNPVNDASGVGREAAVILRPLEPTILRLLLRMVRSTPSVTKLSSVFSLESEMVSRETVSSSRARYDDAVVWRKGEGGD